MAWLYVIGAGLLEVVWALGLKASDGFTRPLPALVTLLALGGSLGLLALGMRELPVGTSYAVFVGVGVAGAVIVGGVFLGESLPPSRVGFLLLLLIALVGLNITGEPQPGGEAEQPEPSTVDAA